MEEYYKQAKAYFTAFEGRQHLPRLKSWYWLAWLATLLLFLYFLCKYFVSGAQTSIIFGLTIGSEVLFLLTCMAIAVYRERQVRNKFDNVELESSIRRSNAKKLVLVEILSKSPHQFLQVVKEIDELRELEKIHRTKGNQVLGEPWKLIYDRDAKARVLTLLTALIGLAAGLIAKSDGINFLDIVTDEGIRRLLGSIVLLVLMVSLLMFGLYMVLNQLWVAITWAFSSIYPHAQGNQTTLNYLVRDLIRFYTPESPSAAPEHPTTEVPQIAPSTNTATVAIGIAAICIERLLIMLRKRRNER